VQPDKQTTENDFPLLKLSATSTHLTMVRFTSLIALLQLAVLPASVSARHPAGPPPDLFHSIKSTTLPSSTVIAGNSARVSAVQQGKSSASFENSLSTASETPSIPTTESLSLPGDDNSTTVSRGGGAGSTSTRTRVDVDTTVSGVSKNGTTESSKSPEKASANTHKKEEKSASISLTAKATKDPHEGRFRGNNKASRLYNRLFHSKSQHASIAKKLKNRNHTNLRRKMMHCSFGLLFTSLNHLIPKSTFVPCMTALTSATLLMELLRYQPGFGWMNDALHWFLGSSLRKHEMEGKFTGSFYFFLGVTVTAALFDKNAACLGIAQLALADPSASYFGRQTRHIYWSRIENGLGGFGRNKGFLGFLGGAVFCVPFNYRVLFLAKFGAANTVPVTQTALLAASFALGLAGAFADLAVPTPAVTLPKKILGVRVPPFHLDDNFVVPIVSGFAATKIFAVMGWPANLQLARFMIFP
jgi:dolichol kinase